MNEKRELKSSQLQKKNPERSRSDSPALFQRGLEEETVAPLKTLKQAFYRTIYFHFRSMKNNLTNVIISK